MKLKQLALLATLMVAGQSWAMTPYEMLHSCDHFSGNCPDQSGGGGSGSGGGISNEASSYVSAFISEGSLWEIFSDSKGSFTIETELNGGKKKVHFVDNAAYLIKPPPANPQMKRSALVYGALAPAMTAEQAKKKADEQKAQAAAAAQKAQADALAAKKAAEAKALAEAVQKAGGVGAYSAGLSGPMSAQKPAFLNEITARTKP